MKIYAPFAGVVRYCVADGEEVTTGTELATVEAIKLEAPVLAPAPGTVKRTQREDFVNVQGGDEIVEIV
ncbi:acetyl-CoA carboxylase biotin carboxyl carrier protein subunit [Corynebacterium sp. 320]|uniref:Acetyl-CoA carboxylase biotin carboxyl carrier protein subunit n=1 Tax=Corynebacterium zhongnanshanii TaxID=2768834 RepID=A0ABQ6VG63_9CORY|nr:MULTISPECIES: biotin/lipoyl-containing protein [Corynebacterium]KAB1503844.1 acetyl-CoA carboxylase biotin carboxyl carrier protein subunit [Corynebacterium sp. 320]KAB1553055.1 acetyl-CoA carboxylase biotin carboxyl carrier protein subunit [Corynebacterium sp. 321]KAB1553724.1 acetyl-CoA carboxylase biotin carboxyl carrier protein subunit [Corynebacterium sp. 319]KAB3523303.1 acetyl-CoA carboxylase biotin carboxyl carrier protein subunit [Corynebacterium zhongnanshanii]KAB3527980.1 acetyl-